MKLFVCTLWTIALLCETGIAHASAKPVPADDYARMDTIRIDGKVLWEDQDISLSVPLLIRQGGTLVLTGTTLRLNGESAHRVDLLVQHGGRLIVQDHDGDAATTTDGSRITVGTDSTYRFVLTVQEVGSVSILNSTIDHCQNLNLYCDNATIKGCTIADAEVGATLHGDGNVIRTNRFERIYKNGLVLNNSNHNDISDNYFYDVNHTDWDVVGTQTQAIAAHGSVGTMFADNVVDDPSHGVAAGLYTKMVGSGIALYDCSLCTLKTNRMVAVHVWAFELRRSHGNVLLHNEVVETHGDGLILLASNNNFIDGFSVDRAEFGVFLSWAYYNALRNVSVANAVELNGAGVRITGSSYNIIEHIRVIDSDNGIILSSRVRNESFALNEGNHLKHIYLDRNAVSFQFDDPIDKTAGTSNLVIEEVYESSNLGASISSTESDYSEATFVNSELNLDHFHVTKGTFRFYYGLGVKVLDERKLPLGGARTRLWDERGTLVLDENSDQSGLIRAHRFDAGTVTSQGFQPVVDSGKYLLTVCRVGYLPAERSVAVRLHGFEAVRLMKSAWPGVDAGCREIEAFRSADTTGPANEFTLGPNTPNPFNAATDLRFTLPMDGHVTLVVFNIVGQRVATVVDGPMGAGEHTIRWDGGKVASGVYFCRLQAGEQVTTRKMLLLK